MMEKKLKYDITVDEIDTNVPHGKILSQIRPGASVLECGCATGYMTRFMRERLNCDVSIVDLDSGAFKRAMQYAKDGICTDLMKDDWLDYYSAKTFDYIIFADVLEHLYNPSSVIKKAVGLLKDDGTMMVSVPNITHNDVISGMIHNSWKYTELGLLDNTHIRFWGESDLVPFFHEAGLSIVIFDYVIVPDGITEQTFVSVDSQLRKLLSQRSNGSVYQFVLTAMKTEYVVHENIIPKSTKLHNENVESNLYYSETGQFDGRNAILGRYVAPTFSQRFHLNHKPTKFLRFDPIEQCACIVKGLEIINDVGRMFETAPVNGTRIGQYDIFVTSDSQYTILNEDDVYIRWLDIQAQITPIYEQSITSTLALLMQKIHNVPEQQES